jgi:hypothetical protein
VVEGPATLPYRRYYPVRDRLLIGEHLRRSNPDQPEPERRHVSVAPLVDVMALIMRGSVDLDDQPGGGSSNRQL